MGDMAQLDSAWPALPLDQWRDTYLTLHLWTQVVGKIRMTLSPPLNHWWHTTLYVTTRGLATSPIPFGAGAFEIEFDFLDHQLHIQTTEAGKRTLPLVAEPVAAFYAKLLDNPGKRHHGARHYFDCDGVILAVLDPTAGGMKPTPGPKSIYFAVDDLERQIGPHVHDDHVERIGADVDGRDAHEICPFPMFLI